MEGLHISLQFDVEKIEELRSNQASSDTSNDPMRRERCHQSVQALLNNLHLCL